MDDISLEQLLKTVVSYKASDLHLVSESEPQIRLDGRLVPLNVSKFDPIKIQNLCYSVLTDTQKKRFEETRELDFTFYIKGIGRFRANYYFERGSTAAAFRVIPEVVPTVDDLKLPDIIKELVKKERGLVLVTGPTGSGKSTTLASMIHEINLTEAKHIITVEDPIEFSHTHHKSLISQRSIGDDTASFQSALKYALREDPDVILIGEMRDLETIRAAITAAETGHLVFGTLHTNSAVQTVNRIINVFPANEQALIRTQLSLSLVAVLSQTLIPKIGGGRVAAVEILVTNPAVSNLIREDKIHQIGAQMQLGQNKSGMQTQSQVLIDLVNNKVIKKEDALKYANQPDEVDRATSGTFFATTH